MKDARGADVLVFWRRDAMSSPSSLGKTAVELNWECEENLEFGRRG
jgi:hypothetical protein